MASSTDESPDSTPHPTLKQSFAQRASPPSTHALAHYLFHLMSIKKSNLCISADVPTTADLLELAELVGDSICMLKTHADIVDDFGERTIKGLTEIAKRKRFLVFEDRKFGDIGSTVQRQYTSGPCRIVQWASFVNAHVFPGAAVIRALQSAAADSLVSYNQSVKTEITADSNSPPPPPLKASSFPNGSPPPSNKSPDSLKPIVSTTTIETHVEPSRTLPTRTSAFEGTERSAALEKLGSQPIERALLLLAEMSTEGSLMTGAYTTSCVAMARQHRDFVVGFIAQKSLNSEPDDNFISFTPGVSLPPANGSKDGAAGDGLGQQYNTPRNVVLEKGCDVIIVGRGILAAEDRSKEAERYRREGWKAYQERIGEI
ncbi:MAG: orotidine 5'-phosphate decarboxylase [Piccolia ochrophora]|nr:MAG: orotidine 5'-phosphate decarboxylase [Piccolia ochrophora]